MKLFSSKRRVAVVAALVLLMLFLVRPGASRLKSRIIISLSAAVGRPVDLGAVHVRLLPQPGFDLENLVVYDDPAFGSEPLMRASEVTAELRLTALLRGRIEVSRLNLTEPSLNLVHRVGGGWNLESLLERTARTPLAPTGKRKSELRPGFPYIEGTSGRINFKNGPEKKPYALTNADFSLWQESENAWGVRIKAQPFRSDMNLNDTGLLQVSGTWQRAGTFHDTPVQFTIEWSRAQVGQVTKFLTGNDKGWRGDIQFDATVKGTPAALQISSAVSADDFRRYDIPSAKSLRMAARCDAEYSAHDHQFREIACSAPVGTGLLTMTGEAGLPGSHRYALAITADKIPASAIGVLAQRAKKDLPEDLAVDGNLQGKISIAGNAEPGAGVRVDGRGEIAELRVGSASGKAEVGPLTIPIIVTGSPSGGAGNGLQPRSFQPRSFQGTQVQMGPFAVDRGRAGSASIRGWLDRSGYRFTVLGDADVPRALYVARMFGLRALSAAAEGTAQLNLQIAGSWMGQNGPEAFAGPQITGTAKLRNVRFGLRGASEPVEISSAEMQLSPETVSVGKLNAKAANAVWRGSLEIPRGCGNPEMCVVHFQLNAGEVALSQVNEWTSSSAKSRPWYRVLDTTAAAPSMLARVRASGRVTTDRFVLRGITASRVSADVSLDGGKLEVSSLGGDLLGGKHRGKWQADFSVKPPKCAGSGKVAGISLVDLSKIMKDNWAEGTASASYEIRGSCAADFWQSAEGTLQVTVTDGSLPHVFLGESSEVLKVRKFSTQGRVHDGEIELHDGKLDSPEATYEISGTATFSREINFKVARIPAGSGVSAYTVTGTLGQPRVAPVNRTEQARLKP